MLLEPPEIPILNTDFPGRFAAKTASLTSDKDGVGDSEETMISEHKWLKLVGPGIIFGILAAHASADQSQVLPEGTPVRMKINRTISSSSARQGENVDFQTLDDVKVNEHLYIPKGSTAIATVTEAVSKGHMGKGGKLNMNVDYLRMPNGEKLALRGIQELKGGGHGGAMTGGMVATAIVFWPAAPLFLFMHGKDISIPEGHEVTVYTNSEYTPAQTAQAKGTDSKPLAGASLHNADVLELKTAGFSDDVILAKVKSSPGTYDLATADLMKLKAAGLSDAVIGAMLSAPAR